MGGHAAIDGSVNVSTLGVDSVVYQPETKSVLAAAGATWRAVRAALRPHGRSVLVMQTFEDFTVGGSVAVNCHGRSLAHGPIASTIRSLTVLAPDGNIRRITPDEYSHEFGCVVGGYGLFGAILQVELATADDPVCVLHSHMSRVEQFAQLIEHELAHPLAELAFAKLAPQLTGEMLFCNVRRAPDHAGSAASRSRESRLAVLGRSVYELSKHGDRLLAARWRLERRLRRVSRPAVRASFLGGSTLLVRQPHWYDGRRADVLSEYFVPPLSLAEFMVCARAILARECVTPMNITLRHVARDPLTVLSYARRDSAAVSFCFVERPDWEDQERHARIERALIDAALACGGTFYLPYRGRWRPQQLLEAYPATERFVAAKLRSDPEERFVNGLWRRLVEAAPQTRDPGAVDGSYDAKT
jgi:FAD/FMN-containing dehydrogenase